MPGNIARISTTLSLVVFATLLAVRAKAQTWESAIVHSASDGRLAYERDANGNRIPEFSSAGYKNGAVPIPTIAVVDSVSPVGGDNTANIQNGINRVASRPLDTNGFRGALLMKAGKYRVAGTLLVRASGVVLRGVGKESDSLTNTIIFATGDSLSQPEVLIAGGGNGGSNSSAWSGSLTANVNITTDSVRVADRTFQVANASPFAVGDNIVIYHPDTTPWKRAVNWGGVPNDTGTTSYWAGVNMPIKFNRYITAINGSSITIDVPVFAALVRSLSQCYIYKTDRNSILTNIGIENLRVDNNNPFNQPPSGNGDERHHAQDAIWLGKIEDAWIRNCTTLHFVHSGFTTSIATRVTIDSCRAIEPISIIDGGRRYNFNAYTASQLILVSNCYASYGRHSYVSNGTSTVSGIVFSNCISEEAFAASEGHRLWSQGLLYDNLREINTNVSTGDHVLGLYNRGDMGSGHGWASAHSVAWNCTTGTGNIIIQKPPTAQNYAIGCLAAVTGASPPAPFNQPQGYIEGTNRIGLNPRSLYLAQLAERLGTVVTQNGRANVKVYLEGGYNAGTLLMEKTLSNGGVLASHFAGLAVPTEAVDSVTIEVRDVAVNPSIRKFKPAWLLSDGTIRSFSDTSKNYVEIDTLPGNYYIVVRHRNHLPIMSATAQALSTAGTRYDFTTGQDKAYGTNPMKALVGGKFGLYAGDANQSAVVTAADANGVFGVLNSTGYVPSDINLSGVVTAADANIIFGNLNVTAQVNRLIKSAKQVSQ